MDPLRSLGGAAPLAVPDMHYAQSDVEAAKEFEGFMVGLLAKQMRSSVPDGPWSNGAMATFADLFDQEIGKRVAEGGAFGLQDSVLKSLTARRGQADPTQRLAPAHPMPTEAIGHAVGRVTSQFGERRDPFTGEHRAHHGIDFAAPAGTPIRAAADGVVRFAGKRGGYGNVVIVEHADGTETRYAHCKELSVQRGAAVSAGENIATVGSTGRSTGPHLHFELRRGGEAVDPKEWIREKGAQVLAEATDSAFER